MRQEPRLPAFEGTSGKAAFGFWAAVFFTAVVIVLAGLAQKPLLLVLGLLAGGLLMALVTGARWALLCLLIETALLDHFTFSIARTSVRPEWIVAAFGILYVVWNSRAALTKLRLSRIDAALGVWLALNGLSSILFAPARSASLKTWAGLLIAASAFYIVRPLAGNKLEDVVEFLLLFGGSMCAVAVIAFLLHPYGFPFGAQWNRDEGVFMAYGTLWEADILGSFAAALLVLWTWWRLWQPGPMLSIQWSTGIFAILALEITLGRGAWLAAVVTLVLATPLLYRLRARFRTLPWKPAATSIVTALITSLVASGFMWFGIGLTHASTLGPKTSYPPAIGSSRLDDQPGGPGDSSAIRSGGTGFQAMTMAAAMSSPTPGASPSTPPPAKPPFLKRLETLLDPRRLIEDPSIAGRLALFKIAIQDWQREPVLGLGPGSFGETHTDSSHQHAWIANLSLRALHDSGIVGLLVLMIFFISLVVKSLRLVWLADKPTALLVAALLTPVIAIWIAAQATEPFQLMWPWLILGLLASALSLAPGQARQPIDATRPTRS